MRPVLVIAVFVAVILAAVTAFLLVPLDSFRAPLERAASRALGRDVHINGTLHASIYPEIGLSASDVGIANVAGGEAPLIAHVDTLVVGAKLIPLFSRDVQVTRLVLERPQIHLEVAKDGSANWDFKLANTEDEKPETDAEKAKPTKTQIHLEGVKISGGEFTYFDARTGKRKAIAEADASLTLDALDKPAELDLTATYNKEKVALTARIDNPGSFMGAQPTKVALTVKSNPVNADFDGTYNGPANNSGTIKLSAPSLRGLIQWAGGTAPQGGPLGAFSLSGGVTAKEQRYGLTNGKIVLDNMHIAADVAVDVSGNVPSASGRVNVDRLDLATYMAAPGTKPAPPAGSAAAAKGPKNRGWSTAPLQIKGLKLVDADIAVAVGQLTLADFALSDGRVNVNLKGGRLTANLAQAKLYGGSGSGRVVADGSTAMPSFAGQLDIKGVQVKPLMESAVHVDRIEGAGALTLNVTARGTSQQAIMNSMNGQGSLTVRDGAIRGVDLAAVARTVQNALSGNFGAATGDKATTDFAELGGTFTITDGVLHNSDFHLLNPFVRVVGNGDVDLGKQTLDFHLEPRAVTAMQGQGGPQEANGLGVPFRISGRWDKLHYKPDVASLATQVIQGLQNGKSGLGNLLGGLMGKKNKSDPNNPDAPSTGKEKGVSSKRLLKGLFGGG